MGFKRIGVFTSIRSEYGLLTPVLSRLKSHPTLELKLLVGGAHLSEAFGMSVDQIKADGFEIAEYLPFLSNDDNGNSFVPMLSRLQNQFGNYLIHNPLDLCIVLGDRFELLPVVTSCLITNTPIAHISGGEFTEGSIDNQVRHAITKMAHLHFPATEIYRMNLIRMGEEGWRICVSGEPGLDHIGQLKLIPKSQLFKTLRLNGNRPVVCCTFHPETIHNQITPEFVRQCLTAILKESGYQIVVTASNFDPGGAELNRMFEELDGQDSRIVYHKSLGQLKFYSLLNSVEVMIGNSSSGLVEAQSFNLPAVNIGERQRGRLANLNVYDCPADVPQILGAINHVSSPFFREQYWGKTNIYGDGNASERIIKFINDVNWDRLLIKRNTYTSN